MMKMKAGIKTSELFVVILGALGSVLVGTGTLTPDEAVNINEAGQVVANETVQLIDAFTKFATALSPILGSVAYVWSRTKVKIANGKG